MAEASEKLRTIVELIIKQRANSTSDVFRYDFSLLQTKLKETQDFEKYGIKPPEQRALLKELDGTEYLKINYVDENTYEWKHDCGWLAEYICPDFNPLMHVQSVFIYLPIENVRPLKIKYGLGSYKSELKLECGRFSVICNGKQYPLSQLKSGLSTQVLEYAWKHRDLTVTRNDLITAGITKNRNKESLNKICKGNRFLIKETLGPFITLNADAIRINSFANINESELGKIASYSVDCKKR